MNEKYEYWLSSIADKKIKRELQKLSEKEIVTNFSSSLSFGTAGMRGVMAPGSGCLMFSLCLNLRTPLGVIYKTRMRVW